MAQGFDTRVIKITKTKPEDGKKSQMQANDEIEAVPVPKSIVKLIIKKRTELGMNQKELQTKANINPKTLSDWENGKGIWNAVIAEKLCKVIKVDFKEFEKLLNEK